MSGGRLSVELGCAQNEMRVLVKSTRRSAPANILGDAEAPSPRDVDVANLLETCFSRLCYHVKRGHSRSNRSSVIIKICHKVLTADVTPFKVTQGHWNQHGSIGHL